MNDLADEYFAAEARPGTTTFDYRVDADQLEDDFLLDDNGTTLAFCIRNVLSPAECDDLIRLGEAYGFDPPQKAAGTLRTAKRTSQYQNAELSERIRNRLQDLLTQKMTDTNDGLGDFYGMHSNWRLVRYDSGDSFCAHQDQMDSLQIKNPQDGTKDLCVSSHTLLINLTPDEPNNNVNGSGNGDHGLRQDGATRFYPDAKLRGTTSGQYERAVDVFLPQGWAVAFRQKGLVHAGQPVCRQSSPKYVAQAGVLRLLPRHGRNAPSVFRLGPGLEQVRDDPNVLAMAKKQKEYKSDDTRSGASTVLAST